MTMDSATPAPAAEASSTAPAPESSSQEEAAQQQQQEEEQPTPLPKIDPITAVQDSIDSLALSLFEALRGVRDAVAPESLEVPGMRAANNPGGTAATATPALSAFGEPSDEMEKDATAKERLLNGLNVDYFPPRAFDLLEPDYDAFLLAYLSDHLYAQELVRRFADLEANKADGTNGTIKQSVMTSSTNAKDAADVKIGDVGYEFRKKFNTGWFTGKVTEIRPLAANGYNRRCVYSDGDVEDLRLEDLEELAKLDPNNKLKKPRLSIKVKTVTTTTDNDNNDTATAATNTKPNIKFPLAQSQYTKLLLESEHQRDVQTTQILAQDILAKSAAVDDLVAKLPGMQRTRKMQMERIDELIRANHDVTRELEEAYRVAHEKRELVRKGLGETTCLALGVEEDT